MLPHPKQSMSVPTIVCVNDPGHVPLKLHCSYSSCALLRTSARRRQAESVCVAWCVRGGLCVAYLLCAAGSSVLHTVWKGRILP